MLFYINFVLNPMKGNMISVNMFTFNALQENTFVLADETKECIIVDPGCQTKEERDTLRNFISENQLHVVELVNTHCHIDHVLGNAFVKDTYHVKLTIHKKDEPTLYANKIIAPIYGIVNYEESQPDRFVEEGGFISFGKSQLEVLFVPGHAPGHIALVDRAQNICIGGDVLFQGSIGRTDLPGGDFDTLISSIHNKIFPLGDDMKVYCGHGQATTVGKEKKTNPFCALKS